MKGDYTESVKAIKFKSKDIDLMAWHQNFRPISDPQDLMKAQKALYCKIDRRRQAICKLQASFQFQLQLTGSVCTCTVHNRTQHARG